MDCIVTALRPPFGCPQSLWVVSSRRVLAIALVAAGLFAPTQSLSAREANPAPATTVSGGRLAEPVVFTQVPAGNKPAQPTKGLLALPPGEGGRLAVLRPDGSIGLLVAGFHSACDPDVAFDGRHVLFAGKRAAGDEWNIFEIAADGTGLRQITRGLGDCRQPSYQSNVYVITEEEPWRQITFVRTDPQAVSEDGSARLASLYSCRLDGSGVQRLTYNLSGDADPTIQWDGRLLFASWRRATLDHGSSGRVALLGANVDGTDLAPFCTEAGLRVKRMPCTTDTLAVFVESQEPRWDGSGRLACVALRRPLHSYRPITAEADGLFHSPSPLDGGQIVAARRPADGSGTHALVRVDPATGRQEPLYDDPRYHDIQAKRIAPRDVPDGRSSVVDESETTGKIYCLDLYTSDLADRNWMPPGTIKRVRLVEGLAQSVPGGGRLAPRRVLGEVPAPADGSFNVEVPANTPIEIQILDDQGMALRSCAWVWARNKQSQGCIGCHEDPELTPTNIVPEALWTRTAPLCPPVAERAAVDFRRDVMPIVEKKCLGCHAKGESPPQLTVVPPPVGGPASDAARAAYDVLTAPGKGEPGEAWGQYVHPGRARTSPLVWHLFGRNTSRPWDGPWTKQTAKPIPPDKAEPLTDEERQVFVRWIDLGAAWETAGAGQSAPQ